MSGADFFDDAAAINPFMAGLGDIDRAVAMEEHANIRASLKKAGTQVIQVAPPAGCQDGVYAANWALVRGKKAVLASLPNARKDEEAYAEQVLTDLGKEVYKVPDGLRFSGQGDALPCGPYLFCGSGYRSDVDAQHFAAQTLGFERIQLRTIPKRNLFGKPITNHSSGWPDSYFYDIDLALAVLRAPTETEKGLIGWCPEAFVSESQTKLRALDAVDKIEVSLHEARKAFACNLVSTGKTVVMSAHAPHFTAELKKRSFTVITPEISELAKGGGYIRCTTLTLD